MRIIRYFQVQFFLFLFLVVFQHKALSQKIAKNCWEGFNSLGGQLGYSKPNINQFEGGLNYYWAITNDSLKRRDIYHTFGP